MSFSNAAKSLISQTIAPPPMKMGSSIAEKLDHIALLNESGFSPRAIFRDLRELADDCGDDEKGIKKQILELMIKVHGLMNTEEVAKVTPNFTIVIQGDGARVNAMLCPLA